MAANVRMAVSPVLPGFILFLDFLLLGCGVSIFKTATYNEFNVDYAFFGIVPELFDLFCTLLLIFASLVLAVGVFGLFVLFLDNKFGLYAYMFVLSALAILQVLLIFIAPDTIAFRNGYRSVMFEYMKDKKEKARKMMLFQGQENCCGFLWFHDWRDSTHPHIPGTCCGKSINQTCKGWEDAFVTLSCGDRLAQVCENVTRYLPRDFTIMTLLEIVIAFSCVWFRINPGEFGFAGHISPQDPISDIPDDTEDTGVRVNTDNIQSSSDQQTMSGIKVHGLVAETAI